mgnify:CR=1 FL=1
MLPSHFFANLARMRLIYRWPLMRNIQPENIAEHSLQVAMVAHALGVISNRLFDGKVDANHAAVMALYHDSSEVLTGDLPTPVKYFNPEIAREYKKIELAAEQRLLGRLCTAYGRTMSRLLAEVESQPVSLLRPDQQPVAADGSLRGAPQSTAISPNAPLRRVATVTRWPSLLVFCTET